MVGSERKNETIFLRLRKNHSNAVKAVKAFTICFTEYLSYLNPKREECSCKIEGSMPI